MKSIMHDKADRTCYLCMMLHGDYRKRTVLQEHHVMSGTANRRLSEKYGLKVYLCPDHHENGEEAVHRNREVRRRLEAEAQQAFEKRFPEKDFREIFGKNCI